MASTLIRRLIAPLDEEAKLPIHPVIALGREYVRGKISKTNALGFNNVLSQPEKDDAEYILDRLADGSLEWEELADLLYLGEYGSYPEMYVLARLGIA